MSKRVKNPRNDLMQCVAPIEGFSRPLSFSYTTAYQKRGAYHDYEGRRRIRP